MAAGELMFEPVLISGAGSGLGMAIGRAVQAAGGRALGLCRSERSLEAALNAGLEGVLLEAPEQLPEALSNMGAVPAAFVDCAHGRVEGLVASLSPAEIDLWAAQDIALRARTLRTVVRLMVPRRKGRCLFISSTAAQFPAAGQGYYAAAKAAGESLYAGVGLELAGRGITTATLRLGWLDSGRGRDFLAGRKEACEKLVPTGRLVSLEEAASTVLFLLSKGAVSMNATVLTMDGGFSGTKPKPVSGR